MVRFLADPICRHPTGTEAILFGFEKRAAQRLARSRTGDAVTAV
jgi:hypothetical protein